MPIGRRDDCAACGASLRVCRMCAFYDRNVSKACREPMADEIADKEQANFCDYFRARGGPPAAAGDEAAVAREKLAALFGREGAAQEPRPRGRPRSEAEAAREKLESLFGKKDD